MLQEYGVTDVAQYAPQPGKELGVKYYPMSTPNDHGCTLAVEVRELFVDALGERICTLLGVHSCGCWQTYCPQYSEELVGLIGKTVALAGNKDAGWTLEVYPIS